MQMLDGNSQISVAISRSHYQYYQYYHWSPSGVRSLAPVRVIFNSATISRYSPAFLTCYSNVPSEVRYAVPLGVVYSTAASASRWILASLYVLPKGSEWSPIYSTAESDVLQRVSLHGSFEALTWYLLSSSAFQSTVPLKVEHRYIHILVNTTRPSCNALGARIGLAVLCRRKGCTEAAISRWILRVLHANT
jgi:hypothetical protein